MTLHAQTTPTRMSRVKDVLLKTGVVVLMTLSFILNFMGDEDEGADDYFDSEDGLDYV